VGKIPDATLARQLGIRRRAVALKRAELGLPNTLNSEFEKRFNNRFKDFVGKQPDQIVASQCGLTVPQIRDWRRRRGILLKGRKPRPRHRWTKRDLHRLGTVPDIELAKEFGLGSQAVAAMRRGRGVSRFSFSAADKSR